MQTMTRAEAADKLIDRYAGYFDISPAQEEQAPLVATCDFHAHSEKYVLSRKAKLWEAGSHEYVYLFSVPHLTEDIYNSCRDYALEHGMAKVEPGPTHMYSYITTMFLCDSCDKAAKKALRKCHFTPPFRILAQHCATLFQLFYTNKKSKFLFSCKKIIPPGAAG